MNSITPLLRGVQGWVIYLNIIHFSKFTSLNYLQKKRHCEPRGKQKQWSEAICLLIKTDHKIYRLLRSIALSHERARNDVSLNNVFTSILTVIALTIFPHSVHASIHTVKQDGTGNYTTIQAGINAAATSDTVLVWPGTYFENIDYNSKSITVASLYITTLDNSYIQSTIIDGNLNGSCVVVGFCTNGFATICGFTIQNGTGDSILSRGGGMFIDESFLNIEHCIFVRNSARSGGGFYGRNSIINFKGSIVKENYATRRGAGINIVYETQLNFHEEILNSVFCNYGSIGCDISKTNSSIPLNIILDTGTVILPDHHFYYSSNSLGYPVDDISWQINYGKIDQVNANLFVSPEGNNNNNGLNWDEPLKTLAYAIKKILPDTVSPKSIFLGEGTYSALANNEVFPITPRSYVSIVGSGHENTIIDAENLHPLLNSFLLTNNYKINNISFIRGVDSHTSNGGTGGLEFYDNDSIYIKNVIITETKGRNRTGLNSALSSIFIDSLSVYNNFGGNPVILSNTGQSPKKIVINNSIIESNGPGSTYIDGSGGGLGIFSSYSYINTTHVVLINVLISENVLTFEAGTSDKAVSGLLCFQNAKVDVINSTLGNNIITNPVSSAQVVAFEGGQINFYNSIINGQEANEIFLGDGQATSYISEINVSHSNVKGGEENVQNWNDIHNFNWLQGNMDEDPLWVGGEDPFSYELQPVSPCINTGLPMYEEGMEYPYINEEAGKYILYTIDGDTITLPSTDLAGNPRISGGRIDMGAYEWQDTATGSSKFEVWSSQLVVYPNPFKSNTFISFEMLNEGVVTLEVINMNGQIVRTIAENKFPVGNYKLVWDGKDDGNKNIISGNYFLLFRIDNQLIKTEKLIKSTF